MTAQFETLILVADGGASRAFEEHRRHGPLVERADWSARAGKAASGQGGTVVDRHGHGRHNVLEGSPADASEREFLNSVAARLDEAAAHGVFEKLVLIAPPKALGVLREAIKPTTWGRIELCDPHDRIHETPEALRAHLHAVRMPV